MIDGFTKPVGLGTSAPTIGERGREWPRDLDLYPHHHRARSLAGHPIQAAVVPPLAHGSGPLGAVSLRECHAPVGMSCFGMEID